jgi:cephalosporin-C deacetylase-like acetyl esterase
VTGTLQRSAYRVDRLVFESRADFPVTANVYVPTDGPGPFPGVLVFASLTVEGKAHPSCQALCQSLARKGLVALVHDSAGQGERSMYLDTNTGEETMPLGREQMTLDNRRCLLLGQSLAGWCVWDGMRALDLLSAMPEVDDGRLAAIGEADGGTLALYLSAIDDRVRVVAVIGAVATLAERFRAGVPPGPRELLVTALAEGLDDWELLALSAPRPVLIANPDDGEFPLEASRETHAALAALYDRLGVPERTELAEVAAPRALARPLREEVYSWLLRWLGSEEGASTARQRMTEPEVEIEAESALQVVAKGQVLASLGGETIFHRLCVSLAEETPSAEELTRPDVAAGLVAEARDHLRRLAGRPDPAWLDRPPVSPGESVEVRFESEPGVALSGALQVSKEAPRRAVLWIDGEGREAAAGSIRAAARLAVVLAVDPRGWTEVRGDAGRSPFSPEVLADLALVVGRPLIGMQLRDVLAAVRLLREMPETRELPLTLRGVGWGAVLALMAGALEPDIDVVEAEGAPLSYRAWLRSPRPEMPAELLLPGALPSCDLPLIAAAVAPRSVALIAPVDAEGRPAGRETAAAEYEITARLFTVFGMEGKFLIDIPTKGQG